MSLSMKELSSLLEFLNEEQVTNKQFDAFASAFQKAGFSKQVRCILYIYILCITTEGNMYIFSCSSHRWQQKSAERILLQH